jgi:pyruvate ferredoxin oxidoreductase alpha subunit
LVEEYKTTDAETILVAMGSVCGTIKDVVDREREKGNKVGLLKIVSYRPFPKEAVKSALKSAKYIGIIDKDISLGSDGALYSEIKSLLPFGQKVSGFIAGLGGRDIKLNSVENIIQMTKEKENSCKFVDLNKDILWDKFKTI